MKFVDYIEDIGVSKLAETLEIEPSVVCNWKSYLAAPKPETARKIVKITLGVVDYVDIYEPYFRHKEGKDSDNYVAESTQLEFKI